MLNWRSNRQTLTWHEFDGLFALATTGHAEPKEKLFSFLRSRLMILARYRVPEVAEDVVQETLMVIHDRFQEFGSLEGLVAFTHQVLRNKVDNVYQSRARKKSVELDEVD